MSRHMCCFNKRSGYQEQLIMITHMNLQGSAYLEERLPDCPANLSESLIVATLHWMMHHVSSKDRLIRNPVNICLF